MSDGDAGTTVTGAMLSSCGVIPDVLSLSHSSSTFPILPVTFPSASAHLGNTLTPTLTTPPPSFTLPPSLPSPPTTPFYTLLALDPDGPSRRNPRLRCIMHMLTTNIPSDSPTLEGGAAVVDWGPPGPPSAGGLHRYVFMLYRQEGEVDVSQMPSYEGITGRAKQTEEGLVALLSAAGGGRMELVAVNHFQAAWDEQVPKNLRERLGWVAVPLGWLVNWLC